jgi:hypothetical protein
MRFKCLTCEALARPVYLNAAYSKHIVDVELIQRGLHNTPGKLRRELQQRIDAIKGYDAILLVYGLCGNATAGVRAGSIPLVLPRAHDCITLFLGGRQRYTEQFEKTPGTFWFVQDYIERDDGSGSSLSFGPGSSADSQALYQSYVEKYGQDNADYLMEAMGAWQAHYDRAAYIDLGIGDGQAVEARAQQEASQRGWAFERLQGDLNLVARLLNGEWQDDFLVLQPGEVVRAIVGPDVIGAGKVD